LEDFPRDIRMSKVIAVCRSDEKATRKDVVAEVTLREDYGVESDAHASSSTHRQVSLLARESIDKMRRMGYDVGPGDFAENLTTEGIELFTLTPGTVLSVGDDVTMEISQIGKECHTGCAIFQQIGKCVMPKEGIFARVLHGGTVRAGDSIKVIE
jgi:MOSC domain-containing protein YiiM